MKLIIATTVLALAANTAFAHEGEAEMLEFAKPKIAFTEAATLATKAAEGDLIALELDYIEADKPVYLADFEGETNMARVMINANTGEVLASEQIDAGSEAALQAYLENFSTHAEAAEMAEIAALVDDEDISELFDLVDEDPAHNDNSLEDVTSE